MKIQVRTLVLAGLTMVCGWRFSAGQAEMKAVATEPPKGFAEAIVLWPGGAPLARGTDEGDVPELFSYPAPGAGPHAAVIVMPGGGYNHLVMEKEGAVEARWLNERGVSAYVLEYRLFPKYLYPAPLLDGARAVRYVRANASKLGVKADAIGVWGFSAGGHMAGYLAAIHDAGKAAAGEAVERVSSRPDFAILSYARLTMSADVPRNGSMEDLIGPKPTQEIIDAIDPGKHVTKDASPSFIYSTGGDMSVDPLNASVFYEALKRAGVPVELHIFQLGPHGTGMAQTLKPELKELAVWPLLLENWMRQNGWISDGR
ncbi:alpha/beta hydrolase [Granulicella tundricola]|uniref:Alpha/beta hydrolase n=1 Tax=Granulicella tundricola (strain ATCC BAA-1859 / DSM 23138 / MP5ACTX9) TaxID=1198114 RepID=E8WYB3_GRATM|nr:alpha/beta hydrolase [Granulicella tundricola]ADW69819.1 alpha/beta hydrolase [Granulicella tundricola MP5ACTX9]